MRAPGASVDRHAAAIGIVFGTLASWALLLGVGDTGLAIAGGCLGGFVTGAVSDNYGEEWIDGAAAAGCSAAVAYSGYFGVGIVAAADGPREVLYDTIVTNVWFAAGAVIVAGPFAAILGAVLATVGVNTRQALSQ